MLHIIYYCFILWWTFRCTYQQDPTDDDNDDDDDDDTDTCSFISGQNCDNNSVCKYCAMCLQSSCILGKSKPSNNTITNPSCNSLQFETTTQYDWYDYCLSSGNDSSGDYCETRTQCYQYLRNSNTSTSYTWRNLTCDPNSCALVTNNGQPAPPPGTLPPIDDPSATNHHHNPTHEISPHSAEEHNPTVIALSVSCTLIFVGVLLWFIRLWKQSSYWTPPCLKQLHWFSSSARSLPNSAPPSFRSTAPDMASIVTTGTNTRQLHIQRSSSFSSMSLSNSIYRGGEHLPSYYSPDPSPPQYEHAIVTQIRGLLEDSNYHYQAGASTSMSTIMGRDEDNTDMALTYRDNALPPPMWMPIYFAQNRNSFSLGRLRRHPQHHQPLTQPSSGNNTNMYERDDSLSSSSSTHEHDLGSSSALISSISTTSGSFTTSPAP